MPHARENVPDVENAVKVESAVIFLVQIPGNVPEKYDVNVSIDLIREVARYLAPISRKRSSHYWWFKPLIIMIFFEKSGPVQYHRIRMDISIA